MRVNWLLASLAAGALLAACGGAMSEQPSSAPASSPELDEDGCPQRAFPLAEPSTNVRRPLDLAPFRAALAGLTAERRQALDGLLLEASLADIQTALAAGRTTSAELVAYYVDRIARYDAGGLNAVMALNPQALATAAALDAERAAAGPRGPRHGLPVFLKDNIPTGDCLPTTKSETGRASGPCANCSTNECLNG